MIHFINLFFVIIASFTALTSASVLDKRAVSQQVYNTLSLYQQYAAASYCTGVDGAAAGSRIICSSGGCPQVQAAGATVVLGIPTSQLYDTASYVGLDRTNRLIIVSFRGTQSARNYAVNAAIALRPTNACPGCQVYTGPYNAWNEVKTQIMQAVNRTARANPTFRVLVTGHSLGGALCTIAGADIRNAGYTADIAAFASPRAGNAAFANFITAQAPSKGNNYRITHKGDIVPLTPPSAAGYRHILPAYYISSDIGVPVTPNDITVQIAEINPGTGPLVTPAGDAHTWYFNDITACSTLCAVCVPF